MNAITNAATVLDARGSSPNWEPMTRIDSPSAIVMNSWHLAAMSDVAPEDAGLASGLVNTSFMMGGALGLAALASLAASRTETLGGTAHLAALDGGYHAASLAGALFAVGAAGLAAVMLRTQASNAVKTAGDDDLVLDQAA
jgi:hypothetical protein